jgi:NTE family protein
MPFTEPPVRFIEPDASEPLAPSAGIALCLSGGGYRAMLFHLGVVKRLNELGYLWKLKRVSSVSGGSITAGVLAMNWKRLAPTTGAAANFDAEVTAPIRKLAGITVDGWSIVGGLALPGSINDKVTAAYRKHLFGQRTLRDIPADAEGPRFIFNATNVQTAALMRFSRPYVADYRVGRLRDPSVELAVAVAASSAFPPFLSPAHLEFQEGDWIEEKGNDLHRPPYTTDVVLTDGGVYDNLGLETAWKRYTTILVSDGGGHIAPEPSPYNDWARHSKRILDVIDNQVRSLRKQQCVEAFIARERLGAYWGIRTDIADFPLADPLPAPYAKTIALAELSTRLARLDGDVQERLINWGYAAADAGLRRHVDTALPRPAGFPYPAAGVGP